MRSAVLPALIAFCLSALLAACAPAPAPAGDVPTAIVALPSPTARPEPTSVPLSFTAAIYRDETNGVELQYPSGWTVVPSMEIGPRGSQAQLRGPGVTDQALPAGSSRVSVNVNLWDPKHDLAAYVTQRKTA